MRRSRRRRRGLCAKLKKILIVYNIFAVSGHISVPMPPIIRRCSLSLSCSLESTLQRRVQPHSQFRYTYTYVAVVLTRAEPPQHNSHTIYNVLLLFYLASANSGYIQFASPIILFVKTRSAPSRAMPREDEIIWF